MNKKLVEFYTELKSLNIDKNDFYWLIDEKLCDTKIIKENDNIENEISPIGSNLLSGLDLNLINNILTQEEKNVIKIYSQCSREINNFCRINYGDDIIKNQVEILTKILDKFTLNKDIILYRGVKATELLSICNVEQGYAFENSKDIGFWRNFENLKFDYKNFLSTSKSRQRAKRFTEYGVSTIFVMNAKNNWKGLDIHTLSDYPMQEEVLLQRNSRFIVHNVDISKKFNEVYLEGDYENV